MVRKQLSNSFKIVAAVLSAATAAVSVFGFARSYGLVGAPAPLALTVGELGVNWVGVSPASDTAFAIGDTLQLAATVIDKNGTALVGATLHWSSDNAAVAEVIGGGKVVAKGAGTTTVVAAVGEKLARARVVVRQRVVTVRTDGDSALVLSEDERRSLPVRAFDARGYAIARSVDRWRSLDSGVVAVDSAGVAIGRAQGRAEVEVTVDDVTARIPVRVLAVPSAIEVVAGGEQRALAGATLPQPVVVRLLSQRGHPVPNVAVRFRTADGRGSTDPQMATTDAAGRARTSWTLGDYAGRQHLLATSDALDSAVAATAESEPVAANTRLLSLRDTLRGTAGGELTEVAGVRVTDSLGRPVADLPVSWGAAQGGRVVALAERTDSLGEARARWTLGPRSGVQRAQVRVGGGRSVPPLELSAVAAAGAPAAIALAAGDGQRGRVGAALTKRVVLSVTDAGGNGVAGVPLALHVAGGAVADSAPVTNAFGRVSIAWTMPRTPGTARLTANAPGLTSPVEVRATALVAAPANVAFASAASEAATHAVAGKPLAAPAAVTVTDAYGNPVPNAIVTFAARGGGATSPARVVTDADGVARTRWKLGAKGGSQELVAAVPAASGSGARATLAADAMSATVPSYAAHDRVPAVKTKPAVVKKRKR